METKPSTAHCHCEPLGAPRRGNLYETELLNANLTSFGERPLAFSLPAKAGIQVITKQHKLHGSRIFHPALGTGVGKQYGMTVNR
ncbi:hypothetical protein COT93_01720 [Candidatus Falkowbacteria bacterium CG10_big_fil_rev_8_21_14_0_10_37_18]|uniref:Uncharacterized protein n=1 Tax=Candidatus Falkowbacteria bacterium CG10_big_fil_rev_8_21_14_0_10_37_18 TaxID=1974562 RepID=A0A2H0VB28_9BACT|nr:MAG: hypothetical protein COT93_01720 [Candidatus Falkowbacteria bacterium CG10_big_fil_rev_8_21_14_0_10_37_18]